MKKILSIIILITSFILANVFTSANFLMFFDIPSLILIFATIMFTLFGTGSIKDFFRAFKISFSKKDFTSLEIADSYLALNTVIKSVIYSSVFILFFCSSIIVAVFYNHSVWGPVMALGLCSIMYACIFCIILMPFKINLGKKLLGLNKTNIANNDFLLSKVPFLPYIFLIIFTALILLDFKLVSNSTEYILFDLINGFFKTMIFIAVITIVFSYLLLIPIGFFKSYFCALRFGCLRKIELNSGELITYKKAMDYIIPIRFTGSVIISVFVIILTLGDLSGETNLMLRFSVSLASIAFSSFSAVYLTVIKMRIEKALDFFMYNPV